MDDIVDDIAALVRYLFLMGLTVLWTLVLGFTGFVFWPYLRLRKRLNWAVLSAWLVVFVVTVIVTWFLLPYLL